MDKVRILKEKKRECVGNQDGLERGSDDADKEAGWFVQTEGKKWVFKHFMKNDTFEMFVMLSQELLS